MSKEFTHITINNYQTLRGASYDELNLSCQFFGQPLHTAPIVLVCHALTGNSDVCSEERGWWKEIVGYDKVIDLNKYTIIAFNVLGNGYDGVFIDNYKDFVTRDIAILMELGLQQLGVHSLYAIVGGSLGAAIAWEYTLLYSEKVMKFVSVAGDCNSSDWLMGFCGSQDKVVNNSKNPLADAREIAMLFYRTPQSLKRKFNRAQQNEHLSKVNSWLNHHGKKLTERFTVKAYLMMNNLLGTIDYDGTNLEKMTNIKCEVIQIAVNSDLLFPAEFIESNKEILDQANIKNHYYEINSDDGHDAFLIEYGQLTNFLKNHFKMEILKFGGRSLANGEGLSTVLEIINHHASKGNIGVVLSARGKSTDDLIQLLDLACKGADYQKSFNDFKAYQLQPFNDEDAFADVFELIERILQGVHLLNDYSPKVKDMLLAQGEILSVRVLSKLLDNQDIKNYAVDARELIKTDSSFGNAVVDIKQSEALTSAFFKEQPLDSIPIITGYIASDADGNTTTLGRNGSNYSASLFANFLDAHEVVSYTNVDGIFSADPDAVPDAKIINQLNYIEANELSNFGADILHSKTILPLVEKNIPLRIKNTFNYEAEGTLVNGDQTPSGIKSITVKDNVSLINFEGKNFVGEVGIDGRIFSALQTEGINVGIISQGSSEREISFVVKKSDSKRTVNILKKTFQYEIEKGAVKDIKSNDDIAVVTIVGQKIENFGTSFSKLKQNNIDILLVNNTLSGENIGLVISKKDLTKATNLIHSQIFGAVKTINLAIIGKGTVGGALIKQIHESQQQIEKNKNVRLNIFAIAGSQKVVLASDGLDDQWQLGFDKTSQSENVTADIIAFAKANHLENLIAIDNTASTDFVENYESFIENGFDLISSNKIANTLDYKRYKQFRDVITKHNKEYLYETNVGAGLPIIDTIKLLHDSGENITRINGVFSGSLSYLFNEFSQSDKPFSHFLKIAMERGYTEPDPREDLCGNDVARKLLILARELDLENEFEDINIENLIPPSLQNVDKATFLNSFDVIDAHYDKIKSELEEGYVMRYVGDLHGDLQKSKGLLDVKIAKVPQSSALGNLKGADSLIEIYTESYGDNPITIMGAGAGAEVTARGVFGDILRITSRK